MLPRPASDEDPLRQSDEILTIGQIRQRLKRPKTTELTMHEEENEAIMSQVRVRERASDDVDKRS